MHYSGDTLLCPVQSLRRITHRILKHPSANEDMYINSFVARSKFFEITGDDMKHALRAAVLSFGEEKLGFKAIDRKLIQSDLALQWQCILTMFQSIPSC